MKATQVSFLIDKFIRIIIEQYNQDITLDSCDEQTLRVFEIMAMD